MPESFIPMTFGSEGEAKLKHHLRDRIMALEEGLTQLHEDKVTKWRKAYEAEPREKTRDFPFYNASNLIVPIVATFSDTLLARVMSAVLKTRPVWVSKIFGKHPDLDDNVRTALEEFMEFVGIEPTQLDLYRVYHEFYGDTIQYGTSLLKCPHEVRYRYEVMGGSGDGLGDDEVSFMKEVDYEGPRPEKIAFEDFMIPVGAKTLEQCDIVVHKRRMTKGELLERRFFKIYSPLKVDDILSKPDRTAPPHATQLKEESLGGKTTGTYGYKEWDIYECWLKWEDPSGQYKPRIIATYHKNTNTLLRGIYDTHSILPYVLGRLFYRSDMIYGYGFCETLWSFQEEISEIHNQRLDNHTIANTRAWRVSPDSKLHAGYRFYPSATVPAEKDEIEPLACGEKADSALEDERFSLELAERRAGISPPMQGVGTGSQGKRGIYTAMGTLSVMQEGNRRTDLNISDLRYCHTKLGRILLNDYAKFGVSTDILEMFGEQADKITRALEAVKSKRIGLPIYSSTSSVNKEVEKQNEIMLTQLLRQHYMGVTQLLAQASGMMVPPPVKQYMMNAIEASNKVMKSVLRVFEKEDIDVLVPEIDMSQAEQPPQGGQNAQPNQQQIGPPAAQPGQIPPMVGGGSTRIQ